MAPTHAASVTLAFEPEPVEFTLNHGLTQTVRTGRPLNVAARATSIYGIEYARTRRVIIARHDPALELQSVPPP